MHDLRLLVGFAVHTISALFLFVLIGGAAALLHYFTQSLAALDMSATMIGAVRATEYFLFGVDLLCFVAYVSRETFLLLRAILGGGERPVTDLPK